MSDLFFLEIEPETGPAWDIEPEAAAAPVAPTPGGPPHGVVEVALVPRGVTEVLPADFPLPELIHWVPEARLKEEVAQAAAAALAIEVTGAEGLQQADVACTALRARLAALTESFARPVEIAHQLHKRLTTLRSEWLAEGEAALKTVGQRIWRESKRLEALAAEERRKAQEAADREARERARRAAEEAARHQAPAPVVEELQRRAEQATAPPVPVPVVAPPLTGISLVTRWKARLCGTLSADAPNPSMAELTPPQIESVKQAMRAVLEGQAPLTLFEINWTALNARARAEKATFRVPGFEAFEDGGVRGRGRRA